MVLGYKIEEWLEKDDAERRRREELWPWVEGQLNEWLAKYGLPEVETLKHTNTKALSESQLAGLRHVIDVVENGRCTDPRCPYKNDGVPEFISASA